MKGKYTSTPRTSSFLPLLDALHSPEFHLVIKSRRRMHFGFFSPLFDLSRFSTCYALPSCRSTWSLSLFFCNPASLNTGLSPFPKTRQSDFSLLTMGIETCLSLTIGLAPVKAKGMMMNFQSLSHWSSDCLLLQEDAPSCLSHWRGPTMSGVLPNGSLCVNSMTTIFK